LKNSKTERRQREFQSILHGRAQTSQPTQEEKNIAIKGKIA
jgi:hypothetical protein